MSKQHRPTVLITGMFCATLIILVALATHQTDWLWFLALIALGFFVD